MIKCIRDFAEQKCASFNQRFQLDLSLLLALFVVAQHSFPIKFFGIGILIFLHFQDLTRSNLSKVPWFYWALPLLELLKFFLFTPGLFKGAFRTVFSGYDLLVCSADCLHGIVCPYSTSPEQTS